MKQVVLAALLIMGLMTSAVAGIIDAGRDAYKQRNFEKALKDFRSLAKSNDDEAQFFLGVMYENGDGVSQDYDEAKKWYVLAAENCNVKAQSNLGVMYASGGYLPKDKSAAHMWFKLAELNGNKGAEINRRILEASMTHNETKKALNSLISRYDSHSLECPFVTQSFDMLKVSDARLSGRPDLN